jgi:hypothetical protein
MKEALKKTQTKQERPVKNTEHSEHRSATADVAKPVMTF